VHFYFKELMVELFFYPVYFRYFKDRPRLRTIAAIFAAAFLGNWLYHFLRDIEWIAVYGLWATLVKWHVYLVYALLLAAGIAVSQIRGTGSSREAPRGIAAAATSAAVILSYCLLGVLDNSGGASLLDCGRFFADLLPSAGFVHRFVG
jgi:hypothetical protein